MQLLNNLRAWFSFNWSWEHWALVKTAARGYPFDYGYLLRLEEAKLREMLAYHQKSDITTEDERGQCIRSLRIAIRLLEILQEKVDLYTMHGELKFKDIDIEDGNEQQVSTDGLKYESLVHPNFRNAHRFVYNEREREFFEQYPHELYLRKATHLYYAIRAYYTDSWWD